MRDDVFDKEWDLWCGLFPAGSRRKGAYRAVLDELKLTDQEFVSASRAAIQTCKSFPTIGEVMAQVRRPAIYWKPELDLNDCSPEELERYYKKLQDHYDLALFNDSEQGGVREAVAPMRAFVYHQLARMLLMNSEATRAAYHKKKGPGAKTPGPLRRHGGEG